MQLTNLRTFCTRKRTRPVDLVPEKPEISQLPMMQVHLAAARFSSLLLAARVCTPPLTPETTFGQMAPPKRGHSLECYLDQVAFPEGRLNICPQLKL